MRYRAHISLIAIAVLVASCGEDKPTAPEHSDDVVDVFTPGEVFTPFTAEISVGGTVRFHMSRATDGLGHNAIFSKVAAGAPPDINVVADTTVDRTFTTRGTFGYICTVHPGMVGEVVVQ